MAFELSERHIDEFKTRGYTVFRQVLPPFADTRPSRRFG